MANKREIFVPEGFYHIYNRANADDSLFTNEKEYALFLHKYFCYSNHVFSTYCYCLLTNHFHFLVQVRPESALNRNIGIFKDEKARSNFIAQHLGNFFNWYATYYNRKHSRKGSLFIHTFYRKPIKDQEYLNQVVCYIHANPVKAGLCTNLVDWKFSSYCEYIDKPNYLFKYNQEEAISWFEDIDNFQVVHHEYLLSGQL